MVHHVQELVLAAEVRVEGVVAAVCGTNGPGRADVSVPRGQRVVPALAVDLADGVDGREVDGVKTHVGHSLQLSGGGRPRPVDRVTVRVQPAGGAGEQLVPGVHQRLTPLHQNVRNRPPRDQLTQRVLGQNVAHLLGDAWGDALAERQRVVEKLRPSVLEHLGRRGLRDGCREEVGAAGDVVGQLGLCLAGGELLFHGVAPRGHDVAPRVHAVAPQTLLARDEDAVDVVRAVDLLVHGHRVLLAGRSDQHERGGHRIVALAPHQRRDRHHLADHGLCGQRPPGDLRAHVVDAKASNHNFGPSQPACIPSARVARASHTRGSK